MRDRLQKFMEIETLTSSRLAEILGVQPSNISHILGGRNKPSFEFIEKMLLRFPKINPDWLLLGKGPIYRQEVNSQQPVHPVASPAAESNLFEIPSGQHGIPISAPIVHPITQDENQADHSGRNRASTPVQTTDSPGTEIASIADSDIERVVIFLKDKSCISYRPK